MNMNTPLKYIILICVVATGWSLNRCDETTTADDLPQVELTGQIIVSENIAGNPPEAAGTPLADGTVFIEGSNQSVTTDSNGNFTLTVPVTGSLSASGPGAGDARFQAGQAVRFFAWKDYSDLTDEFPGYGATKLGVAEHIELDQESKDLGVLKLDWTNAGHFRVGFADHTSGEYPVATITVEGISLLAPIYSNASNGNFDIEYLPPGEDYTIVVKADGYQTIRYLYSMWPTNDSGGNDVWFDERVNLLTEFTMQPLQ